MKLKTFYSLMANCFLSSVLFAEEPKLSVTAELDKEAYEVWEVIELTITIENTGDDTIYIYNPDYWGVSKIDIYDGDGELVRPIELKVNRRPDEDIWILPPGGSKAHQYDNLIWYSCCFGNMYTEQQLKPGNYLLNLSITCPPERFPDYLQLKNNWVGTIYANTVRFTISGYN